MKRNETDLISSTSKRQLTAKGVKFVERMRVFAAEQRGLTRHHKEMREINDKIGKIVSFLIIDKRMNQDQIKDIVKDSINRDRKLTNKI